MKIYRITDPETLKAVIPLMKDPEGAYKVQNVATVWSSFSRRGQDAKIEVQLEVGRVARVYKVIGERRELLGLANRNKAGALAKASTLTLLKEE